MAASPFAFMEFPKQAKSAKVVLGRYLLFPMALTYDKSTK